MKVKELAQGMAAMVADGLGEKEILAILKDGSPVTIAELKLVRGDKEYEPDQKDPDPVPQLILSY